MGCQICDGRTPGGLDPAQDSSLLRAFSKQSQETSKSPSQRVLSHDPLVCTQDFMGGLCWWLQNKENDQFVTTLGLLAYGWGLCCKLQQAWVTKARNPFSREASEFDVCKFVFLPTSIQVLAAARHKPSLVTHS